MNRCFETSHIVMSLLYFCQVSLGLLLINCAVADCPYIFISTILGLWLGYLLIGKHNDKPSTYFDISEIDTELPFEKVFYAGPVKSGHILRTMCFKRKT